MIELEITLAEKKKRVINKSNVCRQLHGLHLQQSATTAFAWKLQTKIPRLFLCACTYADTINNGKENKRTQRKVNLGYFLLKQSYQAHS